MTGELEYRPKKNFFTGKLDTKEEWENEAPANKTRSAQLDAMAKAGFTK